MVHGILTKQNIGKQSNRLNVAPIPADIVDGNSLDAIERDRCYGGAHYKDGGGDFGGNRVVSLGCCTPCDLKINLLIGRARDQPIKDGRPFGIGQWWLHPDRRQALFQSAQVFLKPQGLFPVNRYDFVDAVTEEKSTIKDWNLCFTDR